MASPNKSTFEAWIWEFSWGTTNRLCDDPEIGRVLPGIWEVEHGQPVFFLHWDGTHGVVEVKGGLYSRNEIVGVGPIPFNRIREGLLEEHRARLLPAVFWSLKERRPCQPNVKSQAYRELVAMALDPDQPTERLRLLVEIVPHLVGYNMAWQLASLMDLNLEEYRLKKVSELRRKFGVWLPWTDGKTWTDCPPSV